MTSSAETFESIVKLILAANGFKIGNVKLKSGREQIDFFGKFNQMEWAVQVKFYRTLTVQPRLLDSAAAWLHEPLKEMSKLSGVLIVSCFVNAQYRASFSKKYGLVLIDRSDLKYWSLSFPSISEELYSALEEPNAELLFSVREFTDAFQPPIDTATNVVSIGRGGELTRKLKALAAGKDTWREYEKLGYAILKYLFDSQLSGWNEQKSTTDGANYFDLVCRVKSTSGFWKFVSNDLKSRYLVFEFKNYAKPVKQSEVLTTEKYLMINALRRAAVIITRNGKDDGATAIAQGAMRESGKLILIIDDKDICEMLDMKDKGEDPSDLLFDRADDFLISIPR